MNDDTVIDLAGHKREATRKPSALDDFGRALEARICEVAQAAAASAAAKQAAEIDKLKRRVAWLEAKAVRNGEADDDAD